jgi:hypothetical protein
MSDAPPAVCRRALDEARAAGGAITRDIVTTLGAVPADALELALREFADAHGAEALPVLAGLGDAAHGGVRRAAKRALYRLAQRGIAPAREVAPRRIVERRDERAVRAWVSAIDGSGSRASWILFDGAFGGLELCSLIVNDTAGILEAAGGGITKKRLDAELSTLRATQKLPWLETEPAQAMGLVAEALALHRTLGTSPPPTFERWLRRFEGVAFPPPLVPPAEPDAEMVARGAALLDEPEMAGWFIEPSDVQSEALEILQAQESKLVVTDQIKGEREDTLVTTVVERELGEDARRRWAQRLLGMAAVFDATGREPLAAVARAAAGALVNAEPAIAAQPFARALARRALEVAGEVATGRLSAADVTRKPLPSGA